MHPDSLRRLLDTAGDDALVLDVGGWGKPLARADWVIDAMPHETRGLYGWDGDRSQERFTQATWVVRDICDRNPWPFADRQFDLVVCSHVLEDVRDPIWVCSELVRVARAGYLETPSRLEEQSIGVQGSWVGWGHHRWLVEMGDGRVDFVLKHHVMHTRERDHFPPWFHATLSDDEKVCRMWWDGSFEFGERILTTPEELDGYLADFVAAELARRRHLAPSPPGLRHRAGRRLRAVVRAARGA